MIRTLIVDDEPLARRKIRGFLDRESDFVVVGECGDGREAIGAIESSKPDLVFLDVQMPEIDGFDVIDKIGAERMPATVFVTAFDQYAVRAFDFHAVDYLLKPFDRARFREAIDQALDHIDRARSQEVNRQLLSLMQGLHHHDATRDRLAIRTSGRVVLVSTEEIDWIDAAGNYVRLNTRQGDHHLLRETMASMEKRLDPNSFVRIHRSTIVNVDRIREIDPQAQGEHMVIMQGGQRLTLSRSYRKHLHRLISWT